MIERHTIWGAMLAAVLIPRVGSAADLDLSRAAPQPAYDWTILVGAEVRAEPVFLGSKQDVFRAFPIFDARPFGTPERFHGPLDGVDYALIEQRDLRIGPVAQLKPSRRESGDAALQGLGNVPWALEAGAFAEYWWVPWLRTRTEIRQGINGHNGVVSDVLVDAVVPIGPQLTVSGGPRVSFASAGALRPYFGITAAQSAASGLPIFDPKAGTRWYGAGTQARYHWTAEWATHVFIEYERLAGDAASSPLVEQRGAANQKTIGFGVTRSIDIKSFW
jgi:outer membrane protein